MGEAVTGIDVSAWQPRCDWPTIARDSGHAFAGIKSTEGLGTSRLFAKQWAEAALTPLEQFPYHFLRWEVDTAAAQASHMRAVVSDYERGYLQPAIDIEWIKDAEGNPIHLPPRVIARRARTCVERVAELFGTPRVLVYMPVPFWAEYLCENGVPVPDAMALTHHMLWAAGGVDKKKPAPMRGAPEWHWTFRQIGKAPCAGIVDAHGDPVNVDLNVYAGTRDELRALAGIGAAS